MSGTALTPRLIAGIVRLVCALPFEQVPSLLHFFTGVRVSAETVRRLTERAGTVQLARETAAVAQLERELPQPPVGPALQQLSADGAMVPLVGGAGLRSGRSPLARSSRMPAAARHARPRSPMSRA